MQVGDARIVGHDRFYSDGRAAVVVAIAVGAEYGLGPEGYVVALQGVHGHSKLACPAASGRDGVARQRL